LAAEFRLVLKSKETEAAHLREDVVQRHHLGVFPFRDARVDLVLDKIANDGAEFVVF